MVKKMIFGIAVVTLAISAGTVTAGDYHRKATLVCSDCHTMHSNVSHSYEGGTPDGTVTNGSPNATLLKAADANAMCLTCHDGQTFAPDVKGANTGTHVRGAGALTTGGTPYEDWKGHTLGYSGIIPGGGLLGYTRTGSTTPSHTTLECVNCHSAHGASLGGTTTGLAQAVIDQGQYRNLTSKPNGVTTSVRLAYATVANDPTLEIYEVDPTLGQIPVHYAADNVQFNNPDAATHASAVGSWCKACHTNFHGAETDANMNNGSDWVRHPTAGVLVSDSSSMVTRYTGMTNKVKVMTGAAANEFTPSCFTCHKSHGNQNAFGLIYMKGTGTVTEQGDDGTKLPDLCHQCHGMGA